MRRLEAGNKERRLEIAPSTCFGTAARLGPTHDASFRIRARRVSLDDFFLRMRGLANGGPRKILFGSRPEEGSDGGEVPVRRRSRAKINKDDLVPDDPI
jgi:hypothetical protein